jgi:uncharacterized protein (TIGR03437 family)
VVRSGTVELKIPVQVQSSTGGGGGGALGPGITVISGIGMAIPQANQAPEWLTVLVRGPNGQPLEDAEVRFEVSEGPVLLTEAFEDQRVNGTVRGKGCTRPEDRNLELVCRTDASGQTTARVSALGVADGSSYRPASIVATANNASATIRNAVISGRGGYVPPLNQLLLPTPVLDSNGIEIRTIRARANSVVENAIRFRFSSNLVGGGQDGQAMPNVGFRVTDELDPAVGCDAEGGTPVSILIPDPERLVNPDLQGWATCNLRVGNVQGKRTLRIRLFGEREYFTNFIEVDVLPPAPVAITPRAGNGTTGIPGQQVQLRAVVTAAGNQPLQGVATTIRVTGGTATLSAVSATSNAQGEVGATVTLGNTFGPVTIVVSAGELGTTFTMQIANPISTLRKESGDAQSALAGDTFTQPLVVRVVGPNGAGVAGQRVDFTVVTGSVTLVNTSATTSNDGLASVTVRAGTGAGPARVRATQGTLTADFDLTVRQRGIEVTPTSFGNAISGVTGFVCPGCLVNITARGIASGVTGTTFTNRFFPSYPTASNNLTVRFGSTPGTLAPILGFTNDGAREFVTVQVPWDVTGPQIAVNFVLNGVTTSASVPVRLGAPGFVEYSVDGARFATLLDADNNVIRDARRGGRYRIVMGGLGQTNPAQVTGRVSAFNQFALPNVNYILGFRNTGLEIAQIEAVPNQLGLYFVTFVVPADAALGTASLQFSIREGGNESVANASQINVVQ